MEKQVNKAGVVRVLTGIAAVVAVTAFVVVGKLFADYRHRSQAGGDDVFKYRVTWNPAFQGRYVKEVPDLTVATIYRRHAMGAYRGKDVVVLFWAKRHLACNHEIPHMIELRKVLGQEQIVILAICNETAEHVKHLAAGRGVNFAVAAPVSGALPVPFGEETSIPANFFIDRSGIIKFAAEGLVSLEKSGAAMKAA